LPTSKPARRSKAKRRVLTQQSKGSRSAEVALEDEKVIAQLKQRRFSCGTRPVIRWIKGDGLDDVVTRTAIAQATRLFGTTVDYCLCTNSLEADRVRSILAWAVQPVEWWPLSPGDNPALAAVLEAAGCPPEHYGYWWKWFPERVRPGAPEWILDADMVITAKPPWMDQWAGGKDQCRVSQDDKWRAKGLYGRYLNLIDQKLRLYSGLISLPPTISYMKEMLAILAAQPLALEHDGREDMSEQGVVAATFQRIGAQPIPLYDFPFGRAFQDHIDYGLRGDQGTAWGYHFGNAFRLANPHFERLTSEGVLFSKTEPPSVPESCNWLGGTGQWGVPAWTMNDGCASIILNKAREFAGKNVLELGTSRGRMSAMLAAVGCHVTTVDRHDRGAAQNLDGLGIRVILDEAAHFMATTTDRFDLIVIDFHGNTEAAWRMYAPLLCRCLVTHGTLLVNNARLWKIPEWREETGVRWFLNSLPETCKIDLHEKPLPGVAIVRGPIR
jgi:predicted O-methyltransferase YrrM